MNWLNVISLFASIVAIAISSIQIIQRYNKNVAERRQYGAPLSFWHSIRGRGFWKEDGEWRNE